jgi:L-Ala-D/L-Glu epimerase / N-acetyl-D-glutamate racemase
VILSLHELAVPLREPWAFAGGEITLRALLLVTLEADGVIGYGEAAPLEPYDGVTIEQVRAAIEDCRELLGSAGLDDREEVLAECRRLAVLPQAIAAIDLALWDLAGRINAQPVWRLLGARTAEPVQVNGTIVARDRVGAAATAARLRAAGFACLKVKVGLGDDAGRLAAIRAVAGRSIPLRIDANGAWEVEEAVAVLRALAPAGLELCEEPVSGLDSLSAVALSSPVPIALDESAALPGALERRVCQAACLKLSRCGGISGLIDAAAQARRAGYEVYLASSLDGPLGIAAALHAAAVIQPDRPCGLATLGAFDGRPDPLPVREGLLGVPAGDGLGDALTAWYRE